MNIPTEIRRWAVIILIATALCVAIAFLTMCRDRDTAQDRAQTANATGKALDTVTRETETIRNDEKEKADEVAAIPGANDRLPDDFGRNLECVRRGGECGDPR